MKNLVLAFVALFVAYPAFSQDAAMDGTWWQRTDKTTKVTFLVGVREGAHFMANHAAFSTCRHLLADKFAQCQQKAEADMYETFGRYSNGVTHGQLYDGIDALYADYRNRRLSITALMPVVLRSIGGMPSAEADRWLELMRQPK